MKILFIEDDVNRNRPLAQYLEDYKKWEVIWTTTPKSSLEELKKRQGIDVILLDIMMPADDSVDIEKSEEGMSTGILLIEEIQKIAHKKIPIVVLSARKDLQWLVDQKKVNCYIRKPMSGDEVIEIISKVIEEFKSENSVG